ncbi:MAG TPA: aldo/keto reductase [Paracoccaceae bacterium]|nr:aldo/keto reductase [Paracoccaceae bacterium]
MEYRKLGRTDLSVSAICLGSMTWGSQNTTEEGHRQIATALDHGVNFIDTAEMYPTNPLSKETQGATEEVIGSYFAENGGRENVVIATKITGKGNGNVRDRNGAPITPETLRSAIETSLARLKTDYIDLYQMHWPNRGSYHFRRYWHFVPRGDAQKERANMLECLNTLDELVTEGKILHWGTSNDTAWGMAQWTQLADQNNLPRPISIQNEYSLLCRLFDTDLAELAHFEDIGLLAYSPLAAGILSGKYQGNVTPKGSRRELQPDLGGRLTEHTYPAVDAYLGIAQKHGLDVCQMAIAWAMTRPFMASVIIGATSQAQIDVALGAADVTLSDEVMADIAAAHRRFPLPI